MTSVTRMQDTILLSLDVTAAFDTPDVGVLSVRASSDFGESVFVGISGSADGHTPLPVARSTSIGARSNQSASRMPVQQQRTMQVIEYVVQRTVDRRLTRRGYLECIITDH